MKRAAAVCSIVAAAIAAGCGTQQLDIEDAESTMAKRLSSQGRATFKVDCPDEVEIKKGDTFNCRATAPGQEARTVRVTQLDDDGRVRFQVRP